MLARDLSKVAGYIFVGLPIEGVDTGDYLVRNLIGIDPTNGVIAIGDQVSVGSSRIWCVTSPCASIAIYVSTLTWWNPKTSNPSTIIQPMLALSATSLATSDHRNKLSTPV